MCYPVWGQVLWKEESDQVLLCLKFCQRFRLNSTRDQARGNRGEVFLNFFREKFLSIFPAGIYNLYMYI